MVFTEFVGTVISVVLAVVSETEVVLGVVLELVELRGSSSARGIVDVVFVVVEAVVVKVILFQKLLLKKKPCRLRCLLHVKDLAICFYFGWSGSILEIRNKLIIKVGSKSWLLAAAI